MWNIKRKEPKDEQVRKRLPCYVSVESVFFLVLQWMMVKFPICFKPSVVEKLLKIIKIDRNDKVALDDESANYSDVNW